MKKAKALFIRIYFQDLKYLYKKCNEKQMLKNVGLSLMKWNSMLEASI